MFEHIETLMLRAIFSAKGTGPLPPYLGSTLRGLLGHSIRDFVCSYPTVKCHQCHISQDCAYAQNFASPGNEAGAVNPFVIHSLTRDKVQWNPADECQFDITLIGEASRHVGLFIDALQEMERKGWGSARIPFQLEQIVDPLNQTLIWNSGRAWLRNCKPRPLVCNQRRANSVVIRFDSPVRILVSRNLQRRVGFADLIQSVSRRIALLSHAYTDQRLEWDEESMLAEASKVQTTAESWRDIDFERYSMTRGGKLALPAITGWARYEGDLTPFTPLLEAGEKLHVGKNATIGFGHYRVSYDF